MWRPRMLRDDPLYSGDSCTNAPNNNDLMESRPQLYRHRVLKLDEELACAFGQDFSHFPSAARSTMRHLTSRQREVSQWQARISETVGQVERQLMALEQVKNTTESFLEEKLLYGKLMVQCLEIRAGLKTGVLTQGPILIELKKEVKLTNEMTDLLQKQICILLETLSSLKEILPQLLADCQDKGEAIALTSKCLTHELHSSGSQLPVSEEKPLYINYDKWESHCKDMKQTAENLLQDASAFMGNLRSVLGRLKNAHKCQQRLTDGAMQKKINEILKVQQRLRWEMQTINDEIKDLRNDTCQVTGQIRNCESKLQQTIHCLDVLNQRPGLELCLDPPFISLTLERDRLTKKASGLQQMLQRCREGIESLQRRLSAVEETLATNAKILQIEQDCFTMYKSFLPRFKSIIPTNDTTESGHCGASGPSNLSSPCSDLQQSESDLCSNPLLFPFCAVVCNKD